MSNEIPTQAGAPKQGVVWRSIWKNLTYSHKLTAVILIFVLALFAFAPFMLDQKARIEDYELNEAKGVLHLRTIWQISLDLQTLRVANLERENGLGSDDTVSQAITAVSADLPALQTIGQEYADPTKIDSAVQEIQIKWAGLQNAIQTREAKDVEAGFITLHNSLASLTAEIGNQSRLILDPELDTHYLMNALLIAMPENNELAFQIWKFSDQASRTKLSTQEQIELGALVGQLQSNLTNLNRNLQTAFENNANGEFEGATSEPLQEYLAAAQSLININNSYLANPQNYELNPVTLKAAYSDTQKSSQAFYAVASAGLQKSLQGRIQAAFFKFYLTILLGAAIVLGAFVFGLRIVNGINGPFTELLNLSKRIIAGESSVRSAHVSGDEAGQIALAFNSLAEEVENSRIVSQSRMEQLERRTKELESISEAARDISIIRDVDAMLNVAVSVIRERFGFYHVAIFLLDERNESAALRAASGQSTEEMLAQNYKVQIGAQGVVGVTLQTGQSQIASAFERSLATKNPHLPESKSEIGLPLRGKSLTIGVLNIHSKEENAFTKREIQIFQILADQLSSAINNAQLVEQVETTLAELNTSNRAQTRFNWSAKSQQEKLAYEYDGMKIQPMPENLPTELLNQLADGNAIILEAKNEWAGTTLVAPLIVSGQVIGVLGMERAGARWTSEEISIAEATANRTAITLENARLLEESQRRALKEKTISESTSRISAALSVENILGIAVEELEKVLGDSELALQIAPDTPSTYEQTE
ncbi:MAG: GAF domain-containing protein [Anaerolineales bacterium]|nr:GAF domain-containing protein [Anaerolineales bacterium]